MQKHAPRPLIKSVAFAVVSTCTELIHEVSEIAMLTDAADPKRLSGTPSAGKIHADDMLLTNTVAAVVS
jgi:hypothetical protein